VPPLDVDEVEGIVKSIAKYPMGSRLESVDVAVDELNQSHALILVGGRALVLKEKPSGFALLRPSEFKVLFANRFCSTSRGIKSVADTWLSRARRREYA
jgi:hypothetical protein